MEKELRISEYLKTYGYAGGMTGTVLRIYLLLVPAVEKKEVAEKFTLGFALISAGLWALGRSIEYLISERKK